MKYRSKLEERIADLFNELGVSFEYESTKVPYQISYNYSPDFILPCGRMLEAKGYWDAEDRRKMKAVKEQNPTWQVLSDGVARAFRAACAPPRTPARRTRHE